MAPFNFGSLLGNFGQQAGSQLLNAGMNRLFKQPTQTQTTSASPSFGGLSLTPQTALGAGLIAAGTLRKDEPGEVAEARGFNRNLFTSPTAIADLQTSQLGALQSAYAPYLDQIRKRGMDDVQQRYIAAHPSTVGQQGSEVAGLTRYMTDEYAPQEQAFLADRARENVGLMQSGANTILQTSRPDGLNEALGQMGGLLMASNMMNNGQASAGQSGMGGLTQSGVQGMNTGSAGAGGMLGQVAANGARTVLDQMGRTIGWQTADGQMVPIGSGMPQGAAGQAAGAAGASPQGFQGLLGAPGLSSASGMASGAVSAGGGYVAGNQVGQAIDRNGGMGALKYLVPSGFSSNEGIQAAGGGAAAGAAAGFAAGGPVGAIIGAITGGVGGFTGERNARNERKEGSIAQETAYTSQQRPQAISTAQDFARDSIQYAAQIRPAIQQLAPQLGSLTMADPTVQQVAAAMTAKGFPITPQMTANDLVQYLLPRATKGEDYANPSSANPESRAGLLMSGEVGRFDPGAAYLQEAVQESQWAQQLMNQLVQRAQGA